MRHRSLSLLPLLSFFVVAAGVIHCGGLVDSNFDPYAGAPSSSAAPPLGTTITGEPAVPNPVATGVSTSSRVDLLLVVDDSSSMSDKANVLASSLGTLVQGLAATRDLHIGVIDTSLGTMGGDICPSSTLSHLHKSGPDGNAVASAAKGFIAFDGTSSVDSVIADTQTLVLGAGQSGCGIEAQLESAYRFLVQPDPWESVAIENAIATPQGLDTTLLAERQAFLRNDSLVMVVVLSDEDDSAVDPRSLGGQGWAFANSKFPGSAVMRADGSTTAARATSTCATNPLSADCTSCAFAPTCDPSDPACQKIKSDPSCQIDGGYYGATEDSINVRFQHMKQRYGVDPQFPVQRYLDGFTLQRVPSTTSEHAITSSGVAPYVNDGACTNPLFAKNLPAVSGDELCDLEPGPRGAELVVFGIIGGLPPALGTATPDWTSLLGTNPDAFDESGKDPHMLESVTPRAGLPAPSGIVGDNGTDPVSGREWDTGGNDLQYACTFALPAPEAVDPTDPNECTADENPPVCAANGTIIRGRAYPAIRELRVAKGLGDRGVIGSICAPDLTTGFAEAIQTLLDDAQARLGL